VSKTSLSKSSFIKGLQCHKFLYLYKNHYQLRDKLSSEKLSVFKRGTNIGKLAQQLFPNGINLAPGSFYKYDEALKKTALKITQNTEVLYEAAFKFNDVLIFLDILVKEQEGWHAYEVKSSTEITPTYLSDAALQYYVIKATGLNITQFSLIHVNTDYILKNELELTAFFNIQNVTTEVIAMQNEVENEIEKQKQVLIQSKIPDIAVGNHCYKPYDCEFITHCWKSIYETSDIFKLDLWDKDFKIDNFKKGITTIKQIAENKQLTHYEKTQIDCILNKKQHVEKEILKESLENSKNNVCFIDIQSFKPALPLVVGYKPYQKMIYLISLLYFENNTEKTICWISEADSEHNTDMCNFICEKINTTKNIVIYDNSLFSDMISDISNTQKISLEHLKITDLKDFLLKAYYASYRLKGTLNKDEVFVRLNLKNPFYSKSKINNVYEASDAFTNYIKPNDLLKKEEAKAKLIKYGTDNLKYLKRFFDFLSDAVYTD